MAKFVSRLTFEILSLKIFAMVTPTSLKQPKFEMDEAHGVLEQFALLNTGQHKDSKIVYYPHRIWLEPATGLASWTRPLKNIAEYAWSTEASRDIRNLPLYMAAATECLIEEVKSKVIPADSMWFSKNRSIDQELERLESAKIGLEAHKNNQYNSQADHLTQIKAALKTLETTKEHFKKLKEDISEQHYLQNPGPSISDQLAEKDRQIQKLQEELNTTNGVIRDLISGKPLHIPEKELKIPSEHELLDKIRQLSMQLATATALLQSLQAGK